MEITMNKNIFTVLIVEDTKEILDLIVLHLEDKYNLIKAEDGREAIKIVETEKIDLVILDIMLPLVNGYECMKVIREKKNIPIIIISAKSTDEDKIIGLQKGADDYLAKPFHSKELLARIRAIIRTQTGQSNSKLSMGNIVLDQTSFELSSTAGNYRLSNKEFQILELLMSNPNQLISSERFLEKIWGYDSEAEINVVWVYISYLRKKLTALHANIQIKAVRNAGYVLEQKK